MTPRVCIPADSSALSVGADQAARAIAAEARARGVEIVLARTGSRGLYWLEPMIEVDTRAGRFAYGPILPADAPSLFEAEFLSGGAHPKALGLVAAIPYFRDQQRLIFARCGVIDPLSLDEYCRHGGLAGLTRAIAIGAPGTIEEVVASGLRGRGGAGFPTGIKWRTVAGVEAEQKYVVCNADEGDSGTFADRMLLEGDPFVLIEGMAIAALGVGATKGYVYIRSEYPHAFAKFSAALERARAARLLGPSVLDSGLAFDIEARLGAGAYICGEETSLLESLEGKRAQVRAKPPLPALCGLFGKPTVVNNMLSFASAPSDPRPGRQGLRRIRRRALARLAAVPIGRQRQARRPHRTRVRRHHPPTCRGFRRRNAIGPPHSRGAGRRPLGRLLSAEPARHAARL